jgi:phage shock protein PspC (stress-responsive transcriptional regulator)
MDRFALDRANGKLMGVCAGLARSAGFDVTVVRVLSVLSLFVLGPISVIAYLVTGWVAPERA